MLNFDLMSSMGSCIIAFLATEFFFFFFFFCSLPEIKPVHWRTFAFYGYVGMGSLTHFVIPPQIVY